MGKIQDLTGQRFGMLTVIGRGPDRIQSSGHREITWRCLCDCGNEKIALGKCLKHDVTISCGCYRRPMSTVQSKPFVEKRLPIPVSIQNKLMVGDVIRIDKKSLTLIGKYQNYGRFNDENGFIECFSWWDVERLLK